MAILNSRFTPPVLLTGLGLAAMLGCTGRTLYSIPSVLGFNPTSAPVGANVTITGAGFKGIGVVSFGGAPAPYFQVVSSDQIVATVPADATTGSVVVENAAGLGTSYSSFVVVPAITGISPASGPAGTAVTLTGSGFFGTSSVAIGTETPGQAGSSTFTYVNANQVTVMVGANATTGPVVLTSSELKATGPTFTVTP
jgi:hypothetical protein